MDSKVYDTVEYVLKISPAMEKARSDFHKGVKELALRIARDTHPKIWKDYQYHIPAIVEDEGAEQYLAECVLNELSQELPKIRSF